jgi:branched-chain amino acid transport system substrate-binding protein
MRLLSNVPFLVSLLASSLCILLSSAQAQELVVRIGHAGPLTGNIAHLGKDTENGVRMAIDEANAKGISIGGKKVKFVMQSEDDAAEPRQATLVAQKLVDGKIQGLIGHVNSGTTIPASKIYHDAGIPQISPSATNPKYTLQGYKNAFRVVANDAQLGSVMGRYAAQTLKLKNVAVVDDRSAYGQGLADEFLKSAKANGINIVSRQFTTDKSTDFSAILTAIKAKQPDAIFFGGIDAVGGPMLRQMKQLGISAKFMGGDGVCSEQMPVLAGEGLIDDVVLCSEPGGVEDAQKKVMEDFRAAFRKKYNGNVQIYSPYAYDATWLMITAMQKAGSSDPAKYLPVMASSKYQGVTGLIEFDAKGDVKNSALTLYTFRNKQRVQLAVVR